MNILEVSWKNIIHKKLLSILTILAVMVASALVSFIFLVNTGLEKGAKNGYGPYDLVIGADGSSTQLVMNTFYHFGLPIGNIPYSVYEAVEKHEFVDRAYPIARGDSYKGFSIVGTPTGYLTTKYPKAALQDGDLYKKAGEVVLGSYVAEALSMKVGDSFHGTHGMNSEDEHGAFSFQVVGILPHLGTPDDKAIFTEIESVWLVHEEEEAEHSEEEEAAENEAEHSEFGDVTEIVVMPKGLAEAQLLKTEFNDYEGVQAVYSGKVISDVLSIFDVGAQVIKIIAAASIFIAALSVLLSLSAMAAERRKDIGLLRLLGKPRSYIVYGMLLEANILAVMGIFLGMLTGHLLSFVLGDYIFQYAGIELQPWVFIREEVYAVVVGIMISSAAALVPAARAYKVDPIKLFAS